MAPTMPGAMRPGAPPPRYPMSIRLTPEQMLMYQRQQQMRAAQDVRFRCSAYALISCWKRWDDFEMTVSFVDGCKAVATFAAVDK